MHIYYNEHTDKEMKKIAIYCVNYNSYTELEAYTESIEKAAEHARDLASVHVFVADNTEAEVKHPALDTKHSQVTFVSFNQNFGYFGAIGKLMQQHAPQGFDYVILSNVDLTIDETFFTQLASIATDTQTGWIAPRIYSTDEQRDRNPKIMHRYSRAKLRVLRLFYRFPFLNVLYTLTAYKRKKIQHYPSGCTIYAGHGSFIILTKEYIERCGIIDFPVFLFGEEIYLAEECRNANLRVVYLPELKVSDSEHVSTGKLHRKFYNKCNIEALTYVLNTYYTR